MTVFSNERFDAVRVHSNNLYVVVRQCQNVDAVHGNKVYCIGATVGEHKPRTRRAPHHKRMSFAVITAISDSTMLSVPAVELQPT